MVSFENFVKSMPPSLSELKATPSFCFPFKIPDNPTATRLYIMAVQNHRDKKTWIDFWLKANMLKEKLYIFALLKIDPIFLSICSLLDKNLHNFVSKLHNLYCHIFSAQIGTITPVEIESFLHYPTYSTNSWHSFWCTACKTILRVCSIFMFPTLNFS